MELPDLVQGQHGQIGTGDEDHDPDDRVLARELALCYTSLSLVTGTDAGVAEGEGVTQEEVFRAFGENVARLRELVLSIIAALPPERRCPCPDALSGITLPFELP